MLYRIIFILASSYLYKEANLFNILSYIYIFILNVYRRIKHNFYFGILYVVSVMICLFTYGATNSKQQLEFVQKKILFKEINIKQQNKYKVNLIKQLKKQEQCIANSIKLSIKIKFSLKKLNHNINQLTSSIVQLKHRQIVEKKFLIQQLNLVFKQGPYSVLKLILNHEKSIHDIRIISYIKYFNNIRRKNIINLYNISNELIKQKHKQLQQKQKQQTLLFQYQQQKRILQNNYNKRKKVVIILNKSIKEKQQIIAELRQNERHLSDVISQIALKANKIKFNQQTISKKNKIYNLKQKNVNLTGLCKYTQHYDNWPVHGKILHYFGEIQHGKLRHKGLVIKAKEGSKVRAIADGRVLIADWLQGYGFMIVIDHGKGDMSLYGYNQTTLVKVGETVKAQQPIALIGISGGQGIPSLYFEIRRQGQAINPIPWLENK